MIAGGEITAETLRGWPLPDHAGDSDKDARGRVLAIGGCREVPGGILLAATAALRVGAGKLSVATVASVAVPLAVAVPEALVTGLDETFEGAIARGAAAALLSKVARCDAVVVGPGMMDCDEIAPFVARLLEVDPGPVFIIDAGAIGPLAHLDAARRRHGARIIITPHAGEMASLLGIDRADCAADAARIARRAADDLGVTVVLKGGETHIAAPGGVAWHYAGGGIGLGTSGSGDVLAGAIAGLAARGAEPARAAAWGVFLHGSAGIELARTVGPIGFLARELMIRLPGIMGQTGTSL